MKNSVLFGVSAGLIVFVAAVSVFAQTDSQVTRHVYKGWNLLGNGDDFPRELMAPASYVYGYAPVINKYFMLKPEMSSEEKNSLQSDISKLSNNYQSEYERRTKGSSYWFYYPEAKDVSFDVPASFQQQLFPGWNFRFITWDMAGHAFEDVTGDCVVQRAYGYDPLKAEEGQDPWQDLRGVYFEQEKAANVVGMGMIVKVAQSCQFGPKVVPLPELPN